MRSHAQHHGGFDGRTRRDDLGRAPRFDGGPGFDPETSGPRGGGPGGPGGHGGRGGRGGFGGPRGGGRGGFGGRARRGDVRAAVLAVLTETDAHGYQIIQELAEKTQGRWQPSPGSVYPVLQLLEESGLATSTENEGKRVYSLTDQGRAVAAEAASTAGRQPWEVEAGEGHKLADQTHLLHAAVRQVAAAGTPEQIERAIAIVDAARRDLYTILAES